MLRALAGAALSRGAVRFLLLAAIGLFLLTLSRPAEANISCLEGSATLDFGTAATAVGRITYSCTNYNNTARTQTLCLSIGTPGFPGTASQPKLSSGQNTVDFNVYKSATDAEPWTPQSPILTTITLPANGTVTGSFTFYARQVRTAATVPGNYQAFFFNTILGTTTGGSTCRANSGDFNGQDFTIPVTAIVTEGCTLGTIGVIDFGEQSRLINKLDAVGSVQLTCPVTVSWTLTFGPGRNASGGQRNMINADGDTVAYDLYRDAARTNRILIDGIVSGTGTGAVQSTTVYGRVERDTLPAVGDYNDFVVVVLSF